MAAILKAFACRVRDYDGEDIVHAKTAAKARAKVYNHCRDFDDSITFGDIRVRRTPAEDMLFPPLPPEAGQLDEDDREVILNAFGGGSHIKPCDWGYRNHFCTSPKDERMLRLVGLGLFSEPCGVNDKGETPGWCGAFFYLTDKGKECARALIGEREAA